MRLLLAAFLLLALAVDALADDPDSDKDGLSDFRERHKYFTDPTRADSDGDGTEDGAWDERREHAYTIRTIVRVMRPVGRALTDDYQDVRVLEQTPTWVKLEVIHYPLNTVASAIRPDPDWRRTALAMKEVTSSTLTSNFDESMVKALRAKLAAAGIAVDALDDKALAEGASRWLIRHAGETSGAFTGYFTHFPDGRPAVYPGCEEGMDGYNQGGRSIEEQWARDLFARSMFERGTRGSCTSSAIYLAGGLRALGLPTRIVYCIPAIDVTDPEEVAMLAGLRHPQVRATLQKTMGGMSGWCGHTFNEVFVGGRWRRLNYATLGENVYGAHVFGLMTHVLTVNDWSEAPVARTVGVRQAQGAYDDVFGHGNPYSTVELSDRFGVHMRGKPDVTMPAPQGAWKTLTIEKAVWYASSERPPDLDLAGGDSSRGAYVLLKVRENHSEAGLAQYKPFWQHVSKAFVLQAPGQPQLKATAVRGYWDSGWFTLEIPRAHLERMAPETPYELQAADPADTYRWAVADGVRLVRRAAATPSTPPGASAPGTPRAPRPGGRAGLGRLTDLAWSDRSGGRQLVQGFELPWVAVLARVADYAGDFEALKAYQAAGDGTLWLEAEGRAPIRLRMGSGGITRDGKAWVILRLPRSDRLVEGVPYRLRAQDPGHWQVVGTLPAR